MNKNNIAGARRQLTRAVSALCLAGALASTQAADEPANAQPQEVPPPSAAVDVETFHGAGVRRVPGRNVYPAAEVRDGREGWVQLNMMIDPQGKPYEVMVVDSSGNPAFEKAAVQALDQMSFDPARRGNTPIDSSFMFKMKFAIDNLATGAAPGYVSAYRQFSDAIDAGDKEKADAQFTKLKPQNLYEDAFYHYGRYCYLRKWGTPAEQLAELRLAIAGEKEPGYLPKEVFPGALASRFVLETSAGDYGSALET